MPTNVLMPALSPTMTEGNLAKWHVKEGDEVNAGDVIAEIETDKATMEVEAVDEGTVGKIVVDEGAEGVKVNEVIAILLEEGESSDDLDKAPPPPEAAGDEGEDEAPSKEAKQEKQEKKEDKPAPKQEDEKAKKGDGKPAVSDDAPPAPPAPKDSSGERVKASPLARRMAQQAGIDLTQLKGSGPQGRIVKADIETAMEKGEAKAAPEEAAPAPAAAAEAGAPPTAAAPGGKAFADQLGMEYEQEKLSGMRKTIARRLSESKQTVPHFYLTIDCEVDELLKVRKELNARAGDSGDYKLSVNDFVIRAAALALKKVPAANASWDESGLLYYKHADISVAVATEGGLITPIIKQAETKGLQAISSEMKDLAGRARENKLAPEEYQGGTFSVSNLGMFGIKHFEAIINPPQGCILAVGAGEQRPVVKDGALAVATVMSCTLSVDHRVVDGAIGAEYLAAFKKLIEDPLTMLL